MAASNGSEYFELDVEAQNESFGRPSNAESVADDENELMWAAIERLPSQKRSNFALVRNNSPSQPSAIDVRKLDRANRQLVVQRALATSDQDNFTLLSGVKERLDQYESVKRLT
ncbi:hypothetical protein Leryth_022699 [Lithospermum erythrorhizon]|nr:hypothetical protein Leryth_022699 [Lithospermum erythrorhizon]